jgi:hypothetical protein
MVLGLALVVLLQRVLQGLEVEVVEVLAVPAGGGAGRGGVQEVHLLPMDMVRQQGRMAMALHSLRRMLSLRED